jgi:hypothetical protein
MPRQSPAFKQLLASLPETHAAIGTALHGLIMDIYPEAHESVWLKQNIASYGIGPKKMTEHFAYIASYKKHVNLGFYQGSEMDDPEVLLEGTGAGLRHIKIKTLEDARSPSLKAYIIAALQLRQSQR